MYIESFKKFIIFSRTVYQFQGMGESAEAARDGGANPRDYGARDARAIRATWLTAQHTATRWRVRPGRTLTVTSPLSGTEGFIVTRIIITLVRL
jgi:hypothetical protein